MPTLGGFHTFYWETFSTVVTPPPGQGRGGYPLWQASVIAPSGLGMLGAWWDTQYARLQWFWRFLKRMHRLDTERRSVLLRVLETLESPAYGTARSAVRTTATTLGFNRPEAWKGLSRHLKDSAGRAENTFRHLEACRLLREQANSTLTNPQQHLTVELAYQGFAIKGR